MAKAPLPSFKPLLPMDAHHGTRGQSFHASRQGRVPLYPKLLWGGGLWMEVRSQIKSSEGAL